VEKRASPSPATARFDNRAFSRPAQSVTRISGDSTKPPPNAQSNSRHSRSGLRKATFPASTKPALCLGKDGVAQKYHLLLNYPETKVSYII